MEGLDQDETSASERNEEKKGCRPPEGEPSLSREQAVGREVLAGKQEGRGGLYRRIEAWAVRLLELAALGEYFAHEVGGT
jgi:hypothetical protein